MVAEPEEGRAQFIHKHSKLHILGYVAHGQLYDI
jgi:hypothetical protein